MSHPCLSGTRRLPPPRPAVPGGAVRPCTGAVGRGKSRRVGSGLADIHPSTGGSRDGVRDDRRRHGDLLQGLGQRSADHVPPRMAAQLRRLGRADDVLRPARVPRRGPRPTRPRSVDPDVGRARHGHLRGRCRRRGRPSRPARCDPRRALDRRRRGHPLRRPPRRRPGRQGRAHRRGRAVDAPDRGEPRRHAPRGVRRLPGRDRLQPGPVLPRRRVGPFYGFNRPGAEVSKGSSGTGGVKG